MTRLWSLAFRRSSIAPSVFTVRREFEGELTCWLSQRKLEHAERSGLFSSWVSGWAFADGGVTHYDRYGFASMSSGYRVVGWQSLRTLIGDFGLRSPRASLAGRLRTPGRRKAAYPGNSTTQPHCLLPTTTVRLSGGRSEGSSGTPLWV